MLKWYMKVNRQLRAMRAKALEAANFLASDNSAGAAMAKRYLEVDYATLRDLWTEQDLSLRDFNDLGRHIRFGEPNDYENILGRDLPAVEELAERHAQSAAASAPPRGFETLLHPILLEKTFRFYQTGDYREAVLNSVIAVFDLLRERSGLTQDGAALATEALSVDRPRLVLSELATESGRNDQKGFMQILQGMYLGIRNAKAHSLDHDLDEHKAAQYMVFISLVMRRVDEASIP